MEIFDCSLSGWGILQRHPFITAFAIEPITFTIALCQMTYALRWQRSLRWWPNVNIGYVLSAVLSGILFTFGTFLCIIGLIAGAVIANGYGTLSHILSIYLPLVAGFVTCRLIITWLGYRNIGSYIDHDRW